ncbi:MAG: PAS domain-containing protein [Rhizobiales bacterium]|nr:PAS domain-containing protein [Hyphomicrobiales bacterium]
MLVNEESETSQAQSQILHPGSRALFSFWETTRAAEAAPRRGALDLRQIRDLVPNLVIIEPGPSSTGFRWRLAGTAVCGLYQRELTGADALLGWDSFEAHVVKRFLNGVIHGLQPCLLRFRMYTDLQQLVGAELIGLPLQAEGGGIHVFGGVFPFRETLSLGHRAISKLELSGARSIWTEHLPGDQLVRQLGQAGERPFRPFQVIRGGRGP